MPVRHDPHLRNKAFHGLGTRSFCLSDEWNMYGGSSPYYIKSFITQLLCNRVMHFVGQLGASLVPRLWPTLRHKERGRERETAVRRVGAK